ncbi:hypothetical protein [Sulfitobacter mediterraneus]|jgi:hypothetical protein|uniref:Uncharacterized protein n=1 Tax=Sulfitobacter mediterraneus TaxID=83219 RepID=A0A2T6CD86_9RHOB|nr:hypothetical protein [Sulfitobacter mediterraneus]KIN79560.1 hypothetical protein Z950_93 [Sulfitobacter mediterraneus KCTC 32188]PTX73453.1 hypothetical protein C8N31_107155 [Sulfitobacter mediterraneus]
MGFRICFLGAKASPVQVLKAFGLSAEQLCSEMPQEEWWVAQIKSSGWTVLWSEEETFGQTKLAEIEAFSENHDICLCEINETTMWSSATFWRGGTEVWRVSHAGDGDDLFHIEATGDLPDTYELRRSALFDEQGGETGVDFVFEIPVELIEELIGFRYDSYLDASEVDQFHCLNAPVKQSLLRRIFG